MRRWLRVLIGTLVVVVILLGLGIWFAVASADHLAMQAVERGGTYALGVPVTVDRLDVALFDERLTLGDLEVENPPDFPGDYFLALRSGATRVSARSLLADTVEVPELELDGLRLVLARHDGRTNYGEILDNLERFESGEKGEPPPEDQGPTFRIGRLVVTDVGVRIEGLPLTEAPSLTIERIELEDLDDDLTTAEIAALVVRVVLREATREGLPLPADAVAALERRLDRLSDAAGDVVGRVERGIDEAKRRLEERVGELAR